MSGAFQITVDDVTYESIPGTVLTSDPPRIPVRVTQKDGSFEDSWMCEDRIAEFYRGKSQIPDRFRRYFVEYQSEMILSMFRQFAEGHTIVELEKDIAPKSDSPLDPKCFWIGQDRTPAGVSYVFIATVNNSESDDNLDMLDRFQNFLYREHHYGFCVLGLPENVVLGSTEIVTLRFLDKKGYRKRRM